MIYLYLFGTCFHFIYVFMIIGWYCWWCPGRLGIQFVWYCSNWYYWQSCYLYCGSYIIVVDCFFAQEV